MKNNLLNNQEFNVDLSFMNVEKLRLKARNKFIKNLIILFILSFVVYLFFKKKLYIESSSIFVLLFLSFFIANMLVLKDKREFKVAYKKYFVISIFNNLVESVKFDLSNGISEDKISNTQMMVMGDEFYSNDYVSGIYKGVNFEYSDICIRDKWRDSDGDTHYVTLFKGQWFIFDYNKNFKSNFQVCEKKFKNSKLENLINMFKYNKVEFEDIEFNKMFNVYAQNDLDAFYVLTPSMLENIKEINKKIYGELLFCFIDNKLHIGLSNDKDSFEASIFKKINENDEKKKVEIEIKTILNFIDILNLDNTLFK